VQTTANSQNGKRIRAGVATPRKAWSRQCAHERFEKPYRAIGKKKKVHKIANRKAAGESWVFIGGTKRKKGESHAYAHASHTIIAARDSSRGGNTVGNAIEMSEGDE